MSKANDRSSVKESPEASNSAEQSGDTVSSVQFPQDWNYETSVGEVEETIAQIEAGDLDLEAVFEQFQAAVQKLKQCETFLAQRQTQVDLLIETLNDDGSKSAT